MVTRRRANWILALIATLGLIALSVGYFFAKPKEDGMKCFNVGPKEIKARIGALNALVLPQPESAPVRSVLMKFDLDPALTRDSIFAVRSNRQTGPLFLGPYASEITVAVNKHLAADDGYDILDFTLFRPDAGQICIWTSDDGFPFWGGTEQLTIRLFRARKITADGIIKNYDVEGARETTAPRP